MGHFRGDYKPSLSKRWQKVIRNNWEMGLQSSNLEKGLKEGYLKEERELSWKDVVCRRLLPWQLLI